jgi:hypothetical protein
MTLSRRFAVQLTTVAILAAIAHGSAVAGTKFGCGTSEQADKRKVPLASMHIKTPLYVIQDRGKFSKVDMDKHTSTTISEHGFYSEPALRPSADGRWMSYSGVLKGFTKTQYWLYDVHNNADRLILEHPAWGGGIPQFSPDGKYLVIAASYDRRWDSVSGAGLYLFDTTTSSMLPVKLPTTISSKDAWTSPTWSDDGEELLIMVRAVSVSDKREYYSYRPATKRIERITGHYDSTKHEDVFQRRRREIALFKEILPRSQTGHASAFSPDRKWHAYLGEENADGTYPLNVAGKDGVVKKVALGHYENCGGKTIDITGWLDENHLVYHHNPLSYFVVDAATGKTAELFDEKESSYIFTW